MRIKVGRMPYLNSDVFYWTMPEDACLLVPMVPRQMARAVELGELDAGPVPVAECFRLEDMLAPLGDYCVATKRASVSILLFSNAPAAALDGARVAVTQHTSTSVQLLRVLFAERWKVAPARYVLPDEPHDALLLIGDQALRRRRGIAGYPFVYDLGEEWHSHTGGLPFVYARWVARADCGAGARAAFEQQLGRWLDEGLASLDEIAQGREDIGMSPADVRSYVMGFSYRIGPPERASLARFRESLSALPEWRPKAPPGGRAARRAELTPP